MKGKLLISSLALGIVVPLCGQMKPPKADSAEPALPADVTKGVRVALARLEPAEGGHVHGSVQFVEVPGGVRVVARVAGLTPGEHGFHVHEKGDLSAPDLTSAGGHFNPEHKNHGAPKDTVRHVGDMGNLVADKDGVAKLDYIDPQISLHGEHSIVGRAVIVHGGRDDLKSQPSGDAGPRVAGGIVQLYEKGGP